tara:strand:+ start:442 stop:1872 length:1431 start_codon:yes stop_codon:yes gene_type:complete
MSPNYFMGLDGFAWFVGVVEDRNDPDQIGRVRVRCVGFHTDNKVDLPSDDLPWAHVMHPITDPSMHGMGNSPSFLVEGSWVVGFFRDAETMQQPVIIGTLPGIPKETADFSKGFNDPRHAESRTPYAYSPEKRNEYGPYPLGQLIDTSDETKGKYGRDSGHTFGETDTNRLARGSVAETHNGLVRRRDIRRTKIPTATQPHLPSVSQDRATAETRGSWDQPHPKSHAKDADPYYTAKYPLNHVYESESGHIQEIDDTPAGERLLRQHKSGTYEEIHPKGDKIVQVVGSNYEIIAGASNVFITGNVNVTIEGTKRELIKGDYILEVEGNLTEKVHKNHFVKIGTGESGGNREEEVLGNHSYNINDNVIGRIGGSRQISIEKHDVLTINDYRKLTAVTDISYKSITKNIDITAAKGMTLRAIVNDLGISAGSKMNIKSGTDMTIKTEAALTSITTSTWTHTSGGNISITGPRIDLNPP